jgi:hypothetical protein
MLLVERVIVADEAAEMGDAVVERASGRVVFLGCPVEAQAAALAGDVGDGLDQSGADAMAAGGGVDEQILQIADLAVVQAWAWNR